MPVAVYKIQCVAVSLNTTYALIRTTKPPNEFLFTKGFRKEEELEEKWEIKKGEGGGGTAEGGKS